MRAVSINWDTDGERITGLPTEVDIPEEITDEDDVADYLSDTFGYCVFGFGIIDE